MLGLLTRGGGPFDVTPCWRRTRHDIKALVVFGWPYFANRLLRPLPRPTRTRSYGDTTAELELHVLTSEKDHELAVWAITSFFLASGRSIPVVIHEDRPFRERTRRKLQSRFPFCKLVGRDEADQRVESALRRFPLLLGLRRRFPHILKLVDFALFCRTPRFLALDSDVLFFSKPVDLLAPCQAGLGKTAHYVARDIASVYEISAAEAKGRLGLELPERINCGLANVLKGALDFAFLEAVLRSGLIQLDNCTPWVEQTLWALECGRSGFQHLPDTYVICTGPGLDGVVAKHYVGNARDYFYTEGIPQVCRAIRAGGCAAGG